MRWEIVQRLLELDHEVETMRAVVSEIHRRFAMLGHGPGPAYAVRPVEDTEHLRAYT